MRAYINLDSSELVVSPVLTQRINTIFLVRRDTVPIEVQFVRGGAVVELPAGATGIVGLKTTYAGSFLATSSAWSKTGSEASTVYTFGLNLNTTALDTQFTPDTKDSIECKFEITWSYSSTTTTLMPCTAVVYNDVIRGSESVPITAATPSFLLQSPDNSTWSVSIDNDGVLTATKQ